MFKGMNQNSIKKGGISFNKMVASPRNSNSTKVTLAERQYSISQQSRQSGSILTIDVNFQKYIQSKRIMFPYSEETQISQLIKFLKKELEDQFIYFSSGNLYLDYHLTLRTRKVTELAVKKLELWAHKIKINSKQYLSNFQFVRCVGTGGFSRVYLVRGFGKLMALKAINKQFIVQNEKQNIVESQRDILERCSGHPFITQLYMSFQTKSYLIFCMEYCNGGQLFNLLRKVKRMKEDEARFYFLQTLAAISYLHGQNILYRDLKPQNIILDAQGHVRLADYGLSKVMREQRTHSFCGSAEYMAPEMLLKKGHSFQIDYYCLGALLYELLFGLPPYYSRNQNQLFNNILSKDLEFPQNIEVSKQIKKFLHRMLQKDTDMRFKSITQIMKHPWMKNVNMDDVMNKKLQPPFKTDMFQSNFDSSDFQNDQEKELQKLEREKDKGRVEGNQEAFTNFYYVCQELQQLEAAIEKQDQSKTSFVKKYGQVSQPIVLETTQKSLIKSNTVKNIDSSQIYMQHRQNSPRTVYPQHFPSNSRSNQKLKMFISQSSKLSPAHFITGSSILTPQSSFMGQSTKQSQIINLSRQNSQLTNKSGSKLHEVKSVPYINKNHMASRSPINDRMGSPININNYINIYTNKSPPRGQHGQQISLNNPNSGTIKKTGYAGAYSNGSFDKNGTNSSYKNMHYQNTYGSTNGSIERVKFNSLDKPPIHGTNGGSFLRNAYYQHVSPAGRGYLSNFRDRMNPNQKIKKTYRTSERSNFNFFTPTTPYPQKY